ncbi:MAG: hypothetical protein F6K30_24310 [Cyanothece sp. SIO2G6]|nr:hypothetical protein [Cyanothece sp. SIO2G6]
MSAPLAIAYNVAIIPVEQIGHPGHTPQMLDDPESVSGVPELSGFSLPMTKIW